MKVQSKTNKIHITFDHDHLKMLYDSDALHIRTSVMATRGKITKTNAVNRKDAGSPTEGAIEL